LLLIFKEAQKAEDGSSFKEIIFVQKKDAAAEQWTGRRLGVDGAKEKLGFAYAYNGEDFKKVKIDFSKFDKIIFDRFPDDLGNDRYDQSDLFDLIQQFKAKANITEDFGKDKRYDTRSFRELT